MSEQIQFEASATVTLTKSCPGCGGQLFRVEYADLNYRLVCAGCGRWAWMEGFPMET